MAQANDGAWFPTVVAAVALVMTLLSLGDLLLTSSAESEEVFFGYMFTGTAARLATVVHVGLFLWIAWGSFRRQHLMAFVTAGYLLYLVASLWIWTLFYGAQRYHDAQTVLLLNVLATLVLLALCRVIFQRRGTFDH